MYESISKQNLTQLPPLSSDITILYCGYNQLTDISKVSFLNKLEQLCCEDNRLTELPHLPNTNQNLISLQFNDNLIQNIDNLPNTLKYLSCYNNPLINVPQLPNTLKWIIISFWQIESCLNNVTNLKTEIIIKN